MPTLTIELPEAEYRAALALPESERRRLIVNAFAVARNAPGDDDLTTSVDHIGAIREALTEEEAGRDLDGDAFMADLRQTRSAAKASGK